MAPRTTALVLLSGCSAVHVPAPLPPEAHLDLVGDCVGSSTWQDQDGHFELRDYAATLDGNIHTERVWDSEAVQADGPDPERGAELRFRIDRTYDEQGHLIQEMGRTGPWDSFTWRTEWVRDTTGRPHFRWEEDFSGNWWTTEWTYAGALLTSRVHQAMGVDSMRVSYRHDADGRVVFVHTTDSYGADLLEARTHHQPAPARDHGAVFRDRDRAVDGVAFRTYDTHGQLVREEQWSNGTVRVTTQSWDGDRLALLTEEGPRIRTVTTWWYQDNGLPLGHRMDERDRQTHEVLQWTEQIYRWDCGG